jgi:hypothetical protein
MKFKQLYFTIFIVFFLAIKAHPQNEKRNVLGKMYEEYEQDYRSKLIFNHGNRDYDISDTISESEKGKIKILTIDKRPDYTEITDLHEFVNVEALTIRGRFEYLPLEIGQLKKLKQL